MKLNEKGFAFSTMLYGSITLIAIVLYVILNVNKTSYDTTYYFKEAILKSLNECVTEEVALENCYSTGAGTCNASAYRACLGVSDVNVPSHGPIISETLKNTSSNGLIEDPYEDNRYIFIGSSPKNYILYAGKTWRIVSVEPTGHIKLIDTGKLSTSAWDSAGKGVWGGSTLYSLLNVNYFSSLLDVTKVHQETWYGAVLYPSLVSDYGIDDLLAQEKNQLTGSIKYANVGLLSISDYLKAIEDNICKTDIFGEHSYNCNSWLTQYKGWVIGINGEFGSDDEGYAYYFGDDTVNNKNNKILYSRTNEQHDIYPVIYLNRNVVIKEGNGTELSPYQLY